MHAILDHLTAVLVGTVVLVIVAALSLSARKSGVEAAQLYVAREQTLSFIEVVQQDLANVGAEVDGALPAIVAWVPGAPTPVFEFRGAVAPDSVAPVERIRYEVAPAGSANVTVGGAPQQLPLYRVDRLVWEGGGYRPSGGSPATLTTFELGLLRAGVPLGAGDDPETADEVSLRLAAVSALGDDGAVGLTRWASRYPLANLGAALGTAPRAAGPGSAGAGAPSAAPPPFVPAVSLSPSTVSY